MINDFINSLFDIEQCRAIELKKSLELSVKVNEEIATDRNQSAQDRMVAGQLMANAQLNILKLLKEGPKYMKLDL